MDADLVISICFVLLCSHNEVLTGLRESVYKVEEIKLAFAAQSDPTERRLQELQPIDSEDTGKRNNFRASLRQVCRLHVPPFGLIFRSAF